MMVKKLRKEDISEELQKFFTAYYKCDICGCIFNDSQLAQQCEAKHRLDDPPKS
jgi:translation initiation factor 2 beta subunit (eIF-2beta)/eIF-5